MTVLMTTDDYRQELALWELEGRPVSKEVCIHRLRVRMWAWPSIDAPMVSQSEDDSLSLADMLPNVPQTRDDTDTDVLFALRMWVKDDVLTSLQAEAIYRCKVESWTIEEAATLCGVRPRTLYDHLRKGLTRLQRHYARLTLVHTCGDCGTRYAHGGTYWEQMQSCPMCGSARRSGTRDLRDSMQADAG